MTQYQAFSTGVEIWGASMLGCIEGLTKAGLPPAEGFRLLAEGGIPEVAPGGWYPQQPYLDMLHALEARYGEATLRAMAKQIPDTSRFPPGIGTLEQAVQALDIAYQLNHRGGDIGHYACVPLGPRTLELQCRNPYGCAFDQGILDALIQAFKPEGSRPAITHAPGTSCRRREGPCCTYLITW
jgi:hypothetical protein